MHGPSFSGSDCSLGALPSMSHDPQASSLHDRKSVIKRKSSFTRINNRCVKTGRSKGISKFFKMSRIMIKDLVSKGMLPNIQRDI